MQLKFRQQSDYSFSRNFLFIESQKLYWSKASLYSRLRYGGFLFFLSKLINWKAELKVEKESKHMRVAVWVQPFECWRLGASPFGSTTDATAAWERGRLGVRTYGRQIDKTVTLLVRLIRLIPLKRPKQLRAQMVDFQPVHKMWKDTCVGSQNNYSKTLMFVSMSTKSAIK